MGLIAQVFGITFPPSSLYSRVFLLYPPSRPNRAMNFFPFEREGGFKQCDMVFKTNESANPANICVKHSQVAGVAHSPHGPLCMSRHELPMPSQNLAIIIDEQDRIIESFASHAVADFGATDRADNVCFLGCFTNSRGIVAGDHESVFLIINHELTPAGHRLQTPPVGIARNQSLGKNN